jgi:hypothetical protein
VSEKRRQLSSGHAVEVVVGRPVADDLRDQVRRLWATHGALDGETAVQRLGELTGLVVDRAGIVVGTCSAVQADVLLLGGRRFWVYRSFFTTGEPANVEDELFCATFDALAASHVPGEPGPVGVVVPVEDVAVMRSRPEAFWATTELRYAGYLPGGQQARIRYFPGALIGTDPASERLIDFPADWQDMAPFPAGFAVHELAGTDAVTADDVLALWAREGAVAPEVAARRVDEVVTVVTAPDGTLAGIGSAYVHRVPQLRMDLFGIRLFVASEHRRSSLATHIMFRTRDVMAERYVDGRDRRALGILFEVENPGLRRAFPQAEGVYAPTYFVGERADRATFMVQLFPGVEAPLPGDG